MASIAETFKTTIRVIVVPLALFAFVGGTIQTYIRISESLKNDFVVYHRTAERLEAKDFANLYTLKDGAYPYRYAPPSLIFTRPLAVMTEAGARSAFFFSQVLSVFAAFFVLLRLLKRFTPLAPQITAGAFLLCFRYYLDLLVCGQITGTLLLLTTLAAYLFINASYFQSGVFLILGAIAKLFPVILFVPFINLKRKFKLIAGFVGVVGLLHVLLVSVVPLKYTPALYTSWFSVISDDTQYYDGATTRNQALKGFLQRLEGGDLLDSAFVQPIWAIALLICLAVFAFLANRVREQDKLKQLNLWAFGVIILQLFMPQSLPHSFVLMALPLVALLLQIKHRAAKFSVVGFALFCSIPGSDIVGHSIAGWIDNFSLPLACLAVMLVTMFICTAARASVYAPFHFTADDWGLSKGVNDGILELARLGIVTRVSLMANEPFLQYRLEELKAITSVELGLHFNLTHGRLMDGKLSFSGPKQLAIEWLKSFFGWRGQIEVVLRQEFIRQVDAVRKLGVKVAYCDSHHHILTLPGLFGVVSADLRNRDINCVRAPYDSRLFFSAKIPIALLALALRSDLRWRKFKYLPYCYPLPKHFNSLATFQAHINRYRGAEITLHPAIRNDLADLEFPDSYAEGRVREYRLLSKLSLSES